MKVLIVEDDLILRKYLRFLLKQFNFRVVGEASSGAEAIMLTEERNPDFIIMDILLEGGMDGIEAAERICGIHQLPILFISGYNLEELVKGLNCAKNAGFLLKPVNEMNLLKALIEMSEICISLCN